MDVNTHVLLKMATVGVLRCLEPGYDAEGRYKERLESNPESARAHNCYANFLFACGPGRRVPRPRACRCAAEVRDDRDRAG